VDSRDTATMDSRAITDFVSWGATLGPRVTVGEAIRVPVGPAGDFSFNSLRHIRREMRPKKGRKFSWSSQIWEFCSNGIIPCQLDS